VSINETNSTSVNLQETSYLDFSDYEKRIAELEEEVKSLRHIVDIKDQDISLLKRKVEEKCSCAQTAVCDKFSSKTSWSEVVSNSKHAQKRRPSKEEQLQHPIPTANRFQPLGQELNSQGSVHGQHNPQNLSRKSKQHKQPSRKSKVLLLADSNGRYCGDMIRESLGGNFEVCSIFKPSAKMNQVVENIEQLTKDFSEHDTVILHAGSNDLLSSAEDIECSVQQALLTVQNVAKKTNVLINTVPARYDDFQLNQKGRWVNNIIDQVVDSSNNIVVNYQPERMNRDCFAKDGIHYNRKGKALLCERLSCVIKNKIVVSAQSTENVVVSMDENLFLKQVASSQEVK